MSKMVCPSSGTRIARGGNSASTAARGSRAHAPHAAPLSRKKAEARQMLGEIVRWFSEGFDTKDLNEAKALSEQLS